MRRVAVGLSFRPEHAAELFALDDRTALDVVEVMIDDALEDGAARADMRRLGARWPLVAHGTELGIGEVGGVDVSYVARVGAATSALHVRWYSEHLSFVAAGGVALGHFAPVSSGAEHVEAVARNAARVRASVGAPLLLENPADVLGWEAELGAAALGRAFGAALVAAEAGALLDLTNVVLGARNDGYDAAAFVDAMPLDRIVEIHLAGGRKNDDGIWIDSHDHEVDAEAIALLERFAPRMANLSAVIVERDERVPPLATLLGEVRGVRETLRRAGRVR